MFVFFYLKNINNRNAIRRLGQRSDVEHLGYVTGRCGISLLNPDQETKLQ